MSSSANNHACSQPAGRPRNDQLNEPFAPSPSTATPNAGGQKEDFVTRILRESSMLQQSKQRLQDPSSNNGGDKTTNVERQEDDLVTRMLGESSTRKQSNQSRPKDPPPPIGANEATNVEREREDLRLIREDRTEREKERQRYPPSSGRKESHNVKGPANDIVARVMGDDVRRQSQSHKRLLGDASPTTGGDERSGAAPEPAPKKPKLDKTQLLERITQAIEKYGSMDNDGNGGKESDKQRDKDKQIARLEVEMRQLRDSNQSMRDTLAQLRVEIKDQGELIENQTEDIKEMLVTAMRFIAAM